MPREHQAGIIRGNEITHWVEEGAGNRDALTLAAGKPAAQRANRGVVSLRLLLNKIMCLGHLRGLDNHLKTTASTD